MLTESVLTLDVQLSVDDVAHDRRVVQVLHRVLGSSGAGEQDPGQAQMLPGLWVEQNLHLFHLAKLGAHLRQKRLLDVVIEAGKRHLLEGNGTHVELVQLSRREKRWMEQPALLTRPKGQVWHQILTLNFGTGRDSSV